MTANFDLHKVDKKRILDNGIARLQSLKVDLQLSVDHTSEHSAYQS